MVFIIVWMYLSTKAILASEQIMLRKIWLLLDIFAFDLKATLCVQEGFHKTQTKNLRL